MSQCSEEDFYLCSFGAHVKTVGSKCDEDDTTKATSESDPEPKQECRSTDTETVQGSKYDEKAVKKLTPQSVVEQKPGCESTNQYSSEVQILKSSTYETFPEEELFQYDENKEVEDEELIDRNCCEVICNYAQNLKRLVKVAIL